VSFLEGEGGAGSRVAPDSVPGRIAAELLGLEFVEMAAALTSRKIYVGNAATTTVLDVAKASDARDGLVKAVYSKMFDWIVSMVNENIRPTEPHSMFIGVLDIFGFEVRSWCFYSGAGLAYALRYALLVCMQGGLVVGGGGGWVQVAGKGCVGLMAVCTRDWWPSWLVCGCGWLRRCPHVRSPLSCPRPDAACHPPPHTTRPAPL
jgi:hypothetical protein